MRNIALRLAYDGTDFVGSQWQNLGRSVQSELEGAWAQFTQEQRRFTLAGRTDAGVHAQGQVANIRTATKHSVAKVRRGLNALLPSDIAVLEAWEAPLDFHARHSAVQREYQYLIANSPALLPQLRNYVLHVEQSLDMQAMSSALALLQGQHDFAAFTSLSASQNSTVRRCYRASCRKVELFGQSLIAIDLVANAFLHHMVRTIVGTALLVGRRRMTPEAFGAVLQGRDRRQAGPTASAHGLTLMAVRYPCTMMLETGEQMQSCEDT
ncbi:MAG: tRNA pseudouridine(38-40) synthase TruA [Chloroflexales bacterium]|nr:tRNA pseudouridine(38-40) synthase TruA [Chloroflexales bacterium]